MIIYVNHGSNLPYLESKCRESTVLSYHCFLVFFRFVTKAAKFFLFLFTFKLVYEMDILKGKIPNTIYERLLAGIVN